MRKTVKQISRITAFLLFAAFGCSYSFEDPCANSFMIAPIQEDLDGKITTALVRALSTSPSIDYQNYGANKVLVITISKVTSETIGYRKDQREGVSIKNNILASEERKIIEAQIEVIDRNTQKNLLGPVVISAFVDFDYVDDDSLEDLSFIDPNGVRQTVLDFSLGQLTPQQSAETSANRPLYKKLAEKIVDVISTEW